MSGGSNPRYLVYRLTLQSPLIVTSRAGDPNSAGTQMFIPGSSIRGVIARRLLNAGADPEGEEFRRLVLSGQVRYLNAYLEIEGERSLPVPLSWRVLKDDTNQGRDLAGFAGPGAAAQESEDHWPEEQLEPPGAGFVSPRMSAGLWVVGQPWADMRVHHQRDRQKGRAWKDQAGREHGAIFAYEFLEAGQSFCGVIQLMEAGDESVVRLRSLLERPVVIGRSRRAGYGGEARVEFLPEVPREYAGATGLLATDVQAGTCFRILLTSPCIVRDPRTGQVDPACVEGEICRRLDGAVQVERRRWAFEIVGGFNQKWGLELPQAWAVRAGSVLVVRALKRLDFAKLLMLEHEGIGERRAEGFGRLIVLQHDDQHRRIQLRWSGEKKLGRRQPGADSAADEQLLELIECRLVLEAAEDELHRAAFELAARVEKAPSKALLGQLRSLLRHAQDEVRAPAALETLKTWIEKWRDSDQKAARQLRECRIAGKSLQEWLEALLTPDQSSQWEALRQAAADDAALAVLTQKRCLRNRESADRILKQHAATLTATFLDALFGAITRKEVS
jgi:CRISPR-associated protein Csx10